MTTGNDFTDLLRDVLEGDPQGQRALFQGFLNQQNQQQQSNFGIPQFTQNGIQNQQFSAGQTGNQQDFLSGLFQPTFNKFLGGIGESVNKGEAPTQSFTDFFQSNVNPQRELARATQRQQGINTGSLIGGRSRFLTF